MLDDTVQWRRTEEGPWEGMGGEGGQGRGEVQVGVERTDRISQDCI